MGGVTRLSASDDFDFSAYQPGDAICIPLNEIARMGKAEAIMTTAAIANAATRAGLQWTTTTDEARDEFRISFSELK